MLGSAVQGMGVIQPNTAVEVTAQFGAQQVGGSWGAGA